MKIAVIGGTGFIGEAFIKEYGQEYSMIKLLVRNYNKVYEKYNNVIQVVGTLKDYSAIEQLVTEVEVVVHSGFDFLYQENIMGIKNLLNVIKKHNVLKLIYLSSYMVYDIFTNSTLNENRKYSKLYDIYTKEKQKIEKLIKDDSNHNKSIILQPSVVLGLRGRWLDIFFQAAKAEQVYLPRMGQGICNFVYIGDVIQAIQKAIIVEASKLPSNYESFIISGGFCTWFDIYKLHNTLLKEIDKPCANFVVISDDKGKYSSNFYNDFMAKILFSSVGYTFLLPLIKIIKIGIEKNKKRHIFTIDAPLTSQFKLTGLSKLYHNSFAVVNIEKAKNLLGFKPQFTLLGSLKKMKNEIQEQNRSIQK